MGTYGTCASSLQSLGHAVLLTVSTSGFVLIIVSAQGVVKVRDHWLRKEGSDREVEVPQSELVKQLQQVLSESGSQDALLTKPILGALS